MARTLASRFHSHAGMEHAHDIPRDHVIIDRYIYDFIKRILEQIDVKEDEWTSLH